MAAGVHNFAGLTGFEWTAQLQFDAPSGPSPLAVRATGRLHNPECVSGAAKASRKGPFRAIGGMAVKL